ncbi:hypothetical protein [Rossellomorea aquimaris]|uniref:Uncharacterized protein n=1 Tax=Rossellomorea aquimaris TaxID=189382 RepID=A0A366EFM1_9BACI|nr:hypothetical protein [Rossellomorea aquimaris]RBP01133.1 hypothetical protein DET59_12141 [Rossellomorea aquimaris]
MTRVDNKERVLRLMGILSEETDEDHELSLDDIILVLSRCLART